MAGRRVGYCHWIKCDNASITVWGPSVILFSAVKIEYLFAMGAGVMREESIRGSAGLYAESIGSEWVTDEVQVAQRVGKEFSGEEDEGVFGLGFSVSLIDSRGKARVHIISFDHIMIRDLLNWEVYMLLVLYKNEISWSIPLVYVEWVFHHSATTF